MSGARQARTRMLIVTAVLVALHFYVRPRLLDPRFAPDFLMIALVIYAIRARPGNAAIAGFILGLATDSLVPARFGAAALAHTVVGYLTAWGRAVFFADNLIVNAGVFAAGVWLRDLMVLLASGTSGGELLRQMGDLVPPSRLVDRRGRGPGPGAVPRLARHQAAGMNEFHPSRLHQRSQAARRGLVVLFGVLGVAFFRTQVVEHTRFQVRAQGNRLRAVPLTAPRGTIFDRNDEIIAENVPGYSVQLLATSEDSLRAVMARVNEVVPVDSDLVQAVVDRYRAARYQPAVVFGDASYEVVARLEEHRSLLPGLVIQAEPKRLFPDSGAVAHLVGYVSEVTESDLASNRFPGAGLGDLVGRAGIELQYDSVLRGRPGTKYIEVDVRGRMVLEEGAAPTLVPVAGRPIHTTIDLRLQRFIAGMWPTGVRGAVVAMTPSGEILAMYSAPSYDPNQFIGGISVKLWRELNSDSARPLFNRAIQARYPPASPFKLAMSVIALKRGVITINSHMPIPCRAGSRWATAISGAGSGRATGRSTCSAPSPRAATSTSTSWGSGCSCPRSWRRVSGWGSGNAPAWTCPTSRRRSSPRPPRTSTGGTAPADGPRRQPL